MIPGTGGEIPPPSITSTSTAQTVATQSIGIIRIVNILVSTILDTFNQPPFQIFKAHHEKIYIGGDKLFKVVYKTQSGKIKSVIVIAENFSDCVEKISKLVKIISVTELDDKKN